MKTYEITFIDNGTTVYWRKTKCIRHFGRTEWCEIKAGYAPHIVAIVTDVVKHEQE